MTNYKTEWLRDNGKRYLVWLALAIVFSVACWFLSQWQLSRLNDVRAANALITKNYDDAPTDLASLAKPESFDDQNEYRRVALKGYYPMAGDVLIRNRPLNGQPGFEQFTPFITLDGNLVFVDRGWYPTGSNQDLPDRVQQLYQNCETVTLVGHLRKAERDSQRDYPAGQIGAASPTEALSNATLEYPADCPIHTNTFTSVYVSLESEAPALTTANPPAPNQRPQLSEGNHLSYAMQWVLFAVMAFIALFYMIRQELLIKREQSDKNFKRKVRKTRSQADADYEDQLTERN